MMPTIPQGVSREPSSVDDPPPDGEKPLWLGIDPYAQDLGFARRYSHRSDSVTGADAGLGEYVPFRFYTRRESQDDIALLHIQRRSSNNSADNAETSRGAGPVFDLDPFRRPSMGRSASSHEVYRRRFSRPDVPEAVTGWLEADDVDGQGWCRRRSTLECVSLQQ